MAGQEYSYSEKINVTNMKILRWMCRLIRIDMITNEVIRGIVRVTFMMNKMMEVRVRWFEHVKMRCYSKEVFEVGCSRSY